MWLSSLSDDQRHALLRLAYNVVVSDGLLDPNEEGMLEEFRQLGGIVEHLNTTKFDHWKAGGKVSKALDMLTQEL